MKVFPASVLGPGWFTAIRGPFPDVKYLATGGVTLQAAPAYVQAGAGIVAFGASVVTAEQCDDLASLVKALASPQ